MPFVIYQYDGSYPRSSAFIQPRKCLLVHDRTKIPIARYRKEATGNLDEVQIGEIEEKLLYFRELQDRKAGILASMREQGKLTGELKARIEASLEKSEIEYLYLHSKATISREKALDSFAQYLWQQQPTTCLLPISLQPLVTVLQPWLQTGSGSRYRHY